MRLMGTPGPTPRLNGIEFQAGDAAAVSEDDRLEVKATDEAKVFLFDLG